MKKVFMIFSMLYAAAFFSSVTACNFSFGSKNKNQDFSNETWNYRWTAADNLVKAINDAEIKMHGHTLIWHSQTPGWLTTGNKARVLFNLEKYVTEVTEHYKGKIISWDVVNEAMRDSLENVTSSTNWRTCLRMDDPNGSPWNRAIGPEYIERAFLAARAADPDAMLYYNDYNLNNANKAQAVYNMVNDINSRYSNVKGRPLIDGIGMQSHHHINTNPQTVEDSIVLFASLGVEISITEMDIQAASPDWIPPVTWDSNAAQRQKEVYEAMFAIFKKHKQVIKRVTFWGIDDGTSWRSVNYPTLLNGDYSLKPAFYAVSGKTPAAGDAWDNVTPLFEIYKDDFLVGNVISPGDINNAVRFGIIKRHFNTVTAENAMKPNYIAPNSAPSVQQ